MHNGSYREVSYPFHHKNYFHSLHLKADCYLFPLFTRISANCFKKVKDKLLLIDKNGPYGPIVLQGYHEKEFTLREDYETKSSFTLPSYKAENKSKIQRQRTSLELDRYITDKFHQGGHTEKKHYIKQSCDLY